MNDSEFHAAFKAVAKALLEPAEDNMISSVADTGLPLTANSLMGQLLMCWLGEFDQREDPLSTSAKINFMETAAWMGPDWAQRLYHAAVFITKVA